MIEDSLYTSIADSEHGVRGRLLNLVLRSVIKPQLKRLPVNAQGINKMRERALHLSERFAPRDENVRIETVSCADVPCERLLPEHASDNHLLYLHGGGFIACSPLTHRGITQPLAAGCGATVTVPDYRLAPEHVYPAALEDVLAVYQHLLDEVPANKIAIAGDSAGGNLVLALLHVAKQQGLPMPASAVCLSPWADLTGSGDSVRDNILADPMLPGERLPVAAKLYLNGAYARDPAASPLFADFSGLPPLLFHVGTTEILLDDSRRCVAKARAAKVEAHLRIWPKQPHVFHIFSGYIPAARVALNEISDFLVAKFRYPSDR